MKPICIELFAGTLSWSRGWLERGGYAVGFDIEHHDYHGPVPQGADLVLQDVLTLHGLSSKTRALEPSTTSARSTQADTSMNSRSV